METPAKPPKRIAFMPGWLRNIIKERYLRWVRFNNKRKYIKLGKLTYLGRYFRLDRNHPYMVHIGENSNVDEYNIWNAQSGDINVGKECWFGVYNIMMGPIEWGDYSRTGPCVKILGPRHALIASDNTPPPPTIIGKNVWISTEVIITHGVKIGDNAVIAPGSIVTKDVLPNTYVAGNPARDITKVSGLEAQMKQRAEEFALIVPGSGTSPVEQITPTAS